MKKVLFGLGAIVFVVISYLSYTEFAYSPLEDKDFNKLFKQNIDADKLCSIDFLGFNAKGEFFEIYKYGISEVEIDDTLPNIQVWGNKEITSNTIIGKWKSCPLDALSNQLYDFTLTANDFDKWDCSNTFNKGLKDPENYYCYIHLNELEQYFLLYNPKEGTLYYLRRKGF